MCTKCTKGGQDNQDKMMSKKKWFALLTLFIIYLLLGGTYFFLVESREEEIKKTQEEEERLEILNNLNELLNDTYPEILPKILEEIGVFCDKPIITPDTKPPMWDFYHSVFFAITVCTTIGYGNLAPTTSFSRIFMIAYGLIGIPVNGILFATLGEYFGKTFIRVYNKWKNNKVKDYAASLSLVSQIIVYLIPGLIIFLFLPAIVIQHFEKWDYVLSVYYAFVTLTTIGFGDYVAGVYNKGFNEIHFLIYQLFLLIWIIFGLGYLVMVIGFLTRGLRSKKMARLEKHITQNIKTTHSKLWHGFVKDFTYLRRIMNELYMARLKPVYRDEYTCCAPPKLGSQSFPDLRKLISGEVSPTARRRRAFSECISTSRLLTRVQSDTDLYRIDKEATFASLDIVQPSELLANVANVLTNNTFAEMSESEDEGGYHGFSDNDILASEMYGSGWTLGSQESGVVQPPKVPRTRAASEVKIPMNLTIKQNNPTVDWTWSGPAATQQIQELRKRNKFNRVRTKSRDNQSNSSKSLFERIKSNWSRSVEENRQNDDTTDVEKQQWNNNSTVQSGRSGYSIEQEMYLARTGAGRASVFSVPETKMLEETSVADLLRALTSIHSRVASVSEIEPKRKLGTACLTPPKLPSIIDLFNSPLNMNMNTSTNTNNVNISQVRSNSRSGMAPKKRRFSLHPVSEDKLMLPPPPYSPTVSLPPPQKATRRVSLFQPQSSTMVVAPPNLVHKQVSRLRGPAKDRILYTRTRHNSLKDLNIERP